MDFKIDFHYSCLQTCARHVLHQTPFFVVQCLSCTIYLNVYTCIQNKTHTHTLAKTTNQLFSPVLLYKSHMYSNKYSFRLAIHDTNEWNGENKQTNIIINGWEAAAAAASATSVMILLQHAIVASFIFVPEWTTLREMIQFSLKYNGRK